ncbi:MAG: hypothetical protein HW412_1004, partial [Bacteroidetes bacterium]|nr:hypothetical protein [Bacteroidota bacterium]
QLVDLYQSVGRTDDVVKTTSLVLKEFEDHQQEGWNVGREYAMFAANHGINLAETLNKAEQEYKSRPDNIDALQTYAWALHKNGKSDEAVPYIERALRLGTRNPTLFYQAGMIYRSAGKSAQGDEYLRKALKLNPVFHPLFAADARKALGLNNTMAFRN